MNILLTGASSFTGSWFARALNAAGNHVVMTFCGQRDAYEGLRRDRVRLAAGCGEPHFGCQFGDDRFLALARDRHWDLLCHHGAFATGYRRADFDICQAAAANTRAAQQVLTALGCPLLVTGTVFEPGEGSGSDGLPALSPYGLSKAISYEILHFHASKLGLPISKFVIANPFGPYEEPRFTNYLIKTWYQHGVPVCKTPDYIRDNIHVSLLSKFYAAVAGQATRASCKFGPSGYVESQGAFARRFARAMSARLDLACPVELAVQTDFDQPRVRINTESADRPDLDWDENAAWDELADYYRCLMSPRQTEQAVPHAMVR